MSELPNWRRPKQKSANFTEVPKEADVDSAHANAVTADANDGFLFGYSCVALHEGT